MPLTEEQKAKIKQKEAQMPDALKRDANVNYYEGWFFVTLNTRDEVPVLSVCEGNPEEADGEKGAPRCKYTEIGKHVEECWQSIPSFHSGVTLDLAEFMPEHMHGLLYLKPGNKEHLGKIIGGFMGGCSHAYWDTLGIDWRKGHPTQGRKIPVIKSAAAQFPTDRDRDHTHSFRGPALFVHGYNDMEPITAEEVEVKRAYIRDQARKRLIQGDKHDCFAKHRHQHSANWTQQKAMLAIATDHGFAQNANKCHEAQQNIMTRLNCDDKGICLDYMGARSIMAAPRKLPLICHRSDAARFEQQKEAVVKAAREGAVIVSAFISPKEREIRDMLMTELLPFIEIMDNGFAERYKPAGKAFYAVAENRLVQITPWKYMYQKDGIQVSREMCLVMNELARIICGVPEDWWK